MAGLAASLTEGLDKGILVLAELDIEGTTGAAPGIGAFLPVLLALEVGKHVGPGPVDQPAVRPGVVVVWIPPDMCHGIDRGRSSDDLAPGALDAAAAKPLCGFIEVHPVVQAVLQDPAPTQRNVNQGIAVPSPGFHHKHAGDIVGGKPVGKRTPRRPGADNHVIKGILHGGQLPSRFPW